MLNYSFTAENINILKQNKYILKNISFSFSSGEIICFLGSNGSGKSTLLKVCAGILQPTYGHIFFNKMDIFLDREYGQSQVIGWLPQFLNRPDNLTLQEFMELSVYHSSSVLKNPTCPSTALPFWEKLWHKKSPRHSPNHHFVHNKFEVNHLTKKALSTLSGGEWKRGQLARLWQTRYPIVLLDEPDSDLDVKHKNKLIRLCKEYVQQNNSIMLIASHDIEFIQQTADKICVLSDGRLVWNSCQADFWSTKVINKAFSTQLF